MKRTSNIMKRKPIGIFDSGLGGLTVYKEVRKKLPNEDIVYLGDTARVPYGNRSKEIVTKFALEDVDFLTSKNVKCIVVACNTVSSQAINVLRKHTNIPILDVVSAGANAALKQTEDGVIGVLATAGTVKSGAYMKEVRRIDSSVKVIERAAPLLVPFVEEGELESSALIIILKKYLRPLKSQGIWTIILGCTHYPIIENQIQSVAGANVLLINSGKVIANDLSVMLEENGIMNDRSKKGLTKFYVTDLSENFTKVAEDYLNESIIGKLSKVSLQ